MNAAPVPGAARPCCALPLPAAPYPKGQYTWPPPTAHPIHPGITEDVGGTWRTDVVAQFVDALGLDKLMFEAADPPVFNWWVGVGRAGQTLATVDAWGW